VISALQSSKEVPKVGATRRAFSALDIGRIDAVFLDFSTRKSGVTHERFRFTLLAVRLGAACESGGSRMIDRGDDTLVWLSTDELRELVGRLLSESIEGPLEEALTKRSATGRTLGAQDGEALK
jgi:hypothetical protein